MLRDKIDRFLGLYPKRWPQTVEEADEALRRYDQRAKEIQVAILAVVVVAFCCFL